MRRILVLSLSVVMLTTPVALARVAQNTSLPKPILRPVGFLRAKTECSPTTGITACRAALRHALAAIAWQQKARRDDVERVLDRTRGKQPYAYAAKLAYLACVSFSATGASCHQPSEMLSVGRCESGLQSHDPNPSSTADGWMQYLSGTWDSSTAGQLGYSRFDVLAMGIQTEAIVAHDDGWRQWVCGTAA